MSKLNKKFLAALLCTVMMFGSTLTVAAADKTEAGVGNTVEGENKVEEPIYSVTLPATLNFAVDAFEQKGEGQIVSADIPVINNSNVAVKMNVAITVADGTGDGTVAFAATEDALDTTEDVKSVFLQAEVADTVTETKANVAAYTTAVVKDAEGNYYVSEAIAKEVSGDEGISVNAATEMVAVESVAGEAAASPVVYTLGETATELDFALAASKYIKYYSDASTVAQQFQATADDNFSSACYSFTGKVNPNVVWVEDDFKISAVYTFKGMTTSDYEAADFVEDAHGLLVPVVDPVEPTFASDTVGVVTWSGDAGTSAVKSIDKIEVTAFGSTSDVLAASDNWQEATIDVPGKKVTLDAGVASYFGEDLTATITYTDNADQVQTDTITLNLAE